MLVALLVVLGINLIVVAVFGAVVISRRRWLRGQPGHFVGSIRVSSGNCDGLSPKWKRGYGRRVRTVLIWNKPPLLFRTEVVPVDRVWGERQAVRGEVKGLDDGGYIIEFASDDATIEVAVSAEDKPLLAGPTARAV